MKNQLLPVIQKIETYAEKQHLNHRFVGGVSYGGLVNKKTTYEISITERRIKLLHHNPLPLYRDDKTIKDIDLILFCDDGKKLLEFKKFLIDLEQQAFKTHEAFPLVSVENAIYESRGMRDPISQFVTSLEVDKNNNLYLTFDDITQEISWDSVEPWHVTLENGTTYTTRNPIADYYAYHYRSPGGLKPKDAEKIADLRKLANAVIKAGKEQTPPIDYLSNHYYKTWQEYLKKIDTTTNVRIKIKKGLLWLYWMTIGTTFAHGKGLLRYLLVFSNQFTGMRQ